MAGKINGIAADRSGSARDDGGAAVLTPDVRERLKTTLESLRQCGRRAGAIVKIAELPCAPDPCEGDCTDYRSDDYHELARGVATLGEDLRDALDGLIEDLDEWPQSRVGLPAVNTALAPEFDRLMGFVPAGFLRANLVLDLGVLVLSALDAAVVKRLLKALSENAHRLGEGTAAMIEGIEEAIADDVFRAAQETAKSPAERRIAAWYEAADGFLDRVTDAVNGLRAADPFDRKRDTTAVVRSGDGGDSWQETGERSAELVGAGQ